jgi:hypothetical protein
MKRFIITTLFLISILGWADITKAPWPNVVRDFPLQSDTLVIKGFKIILNDAADQSAGGSGGAVYDITVMDTVTGDKRLLAEQSVGVRVLESFHGWPQLEIWSRGGGGS